jgi:hypothetical protein
MFDVKAEEKLGFYVYALIDPREPNVPFHVGKGYRNPVFTHTPPMKWQSMTNRKSMRCASKR